MSYHHKVSVSINKPSYSSSVDKFNIVKIRGTGCRSNIGYRLSLLHRRRMQNTKKLRIVTHYFFQSKRNSRIVDSVPKKSRIFSPSVYGSTSSLLAYHIDNLCIFFAATTQCLTTYRYIVKQIFNLDHSGILLGIENDVERNSTVI